MCLTLTLSLSLSLYPADYRFESCQPWPSIYFFIAHCTLYSLLLHYMFQNNNVWMMAMITFEFFLPHKIIPLDRNTSCSNFACLPHCFRYRHHPQKSCRDVYKFLFSYHLPPPPSPLLNNNNGETIIRVIGKGQVMLQREYSALARIFIKIQCNIINILIIRMIATYRIFSLCFPCCYTPLSGVSHVQIIITSITIVVLRMLHYY